MARSIMIDLETLGSVPGCSIVSIGAAAFGPDGWVSDTLYLVVSRASCRLNGLHEDEDTLRWWDQQSAEARSVLVLADDPQSACSLTEAINELNRFVARQGSKVEVWGNGSDFDNAILAVAARAVGLKLAWPFYSNRCYRTIKSRMPWLPIRREGTHHNALYDARSQAQHLGRLNRAMALSGDTIVQANIFLGWMADRYRERTARRVFGIKVHRISRAVAMQYALATFDVIPLDEPFGHPDFDWDRDGAHALVDEDMQHWEA